MGRMNTGEAFEREVAAYLNARYGHLGVAFESHGSGDDSFSNDLAILGRPGLNDVEVKQAKAPTGQFTLAIEDDTLVWSDTPRCVGDTLDETAAIIDALNRAWPVASRLVEAVMRGRTTIPVPCSPATLGEWVRNYLHLMKGNDILITGTRGDMGTLGCIDLRKQGCLDGLITASVRKRTSGTRDVAPARMAAAAAEVGDHLRSLGLDPADFTVAPRPYRDRQRLYVEGDLPAWGRRDTERYVGGEGLGTASYYLSPNDQAVRQLSAGAGNPCVSFWGDFRTVPAGLDALDRYLGLR